MTKKHAPIYLSTYERDSIKTIDDLIGFIQTNFPWMSTEIPLLQKCQGLGGQIMSASYGAYLSVVVDSDFDLSDRQFFYSLRGLIHNRNANDKTIHILKKMYDCYIGKVFSIDGFDNVEILCNSSLFFKSRVNQSADKSADSQLEIEILPTEKTYNSQDLQAHHSFVDDFNIFCERPQFDWDCAPKWATDFRQYLQNFNML